jgi:arginase
MPQFVCIGVPTFLGEHRADRAEVDAVKKSAFAGAIGAPWIDLAPDFGATGDPLVAVNRALAETVAAQRPAISIIFAADCVSALGAVKGLGGDVGVIWYDAHGDFNTPETSPSGFLGGMPLAMLVGRGDVRLLEALDLAPLDERDVILTDARDLDPAEAVAVRTSAITHLPRVDQLLTAPLPAKPLYIHLDVDVVDPDELPVSGYPAPGGPRLDAVAATLARVARDGTVAGLLVSLCSDALSTDPLVLADMLRLVRAVVDGCRN